MSEETVRAIHPISKLNAEVHIPPSKSYTNRALIAAALADGPSKILNPSQSEDSQYLIDALPEFGIQLKRHKEFIEISGSGGILQAPSKEIFVGNAGTAMRFLSGFAAIAPGTTEINGDAQMQQRPMNDLLAALKTAGIKCTSTNGNPPVKIHGGNFVGGTIELDASTSSQYLSALLLAAPYAKRPTSIRVKGKTSSLPYIDMTLHVMRSFGAIFDDVDMKLFRIDHNQHYIGHDFTIEGDASAATYFAAAAAITGGKISIPHLSRESLQGDVKFFDILSDMGCSVTTSDNTIEIQGGLLRGIEIDMNQIPDCVPALAVVAAFSEGPTTIYNIAHLQYKETNRLTAIARELTKLGARVEVADDTMVIHPKQLHGTEIETYNDHRIAMAFAIAGLRINGITIKNPGCVKKSFPDFWKEFQKLEGQ